MTKHKQDEIKRQYAKIAQAVTTTKKSSCCGEATCCQDATETTGFYSADEILGLPEEAINASLGCANPIVLANLQKGETVLDLGCGGGIDVLISAKLVGDDGMVYGLDMTDDMLTLANQNKQKCKANNVRFVKGYIEAIPLLDETVDVIMSNCVINLSEDKKAAIKEAYRVLKKGGRLAIADIVELKKTPDEIKKSIQMWVGCIAGALSVQDYRQILQGVGFKDIDIIPVNIYSKEYVKSMAEESEQSDMFSHLDQDALDEAFAGAHIKAQK